MGLTATDASGNTASCTAIVTIADFLTLQAIVPTPPTCMGGTDGTLLILASATFPDLEMSFSINGGGSWQFVNLFQNLNAGTYSVVIRVHKTMLCYHYATATIPDGAAFQTYYKDLDGDNYSDGVAQQACPPPPGFELPANLIATSGDCNDNDPLQFPGQTWYRDQDSDGYSNGQTLVQCSKPTNYKAAIQLSATTGDCNDTNGGINPAATEICNSLDDDCDSQTDEGLSGATYVGNITFSTPTQLNNWAQCYSVIQGNVTIQNSGVTSLAKLGNITKITGNLTIKSTGLDNLLGLNNLKKVGGALTINNNGTLDSLAGLAGLDTVGTTLKIYLNTKLALCCLVKGLVNETGIRHVGGVITIYSNKDGCSSVAQINSACSDFGGDGEGEMEDNLSRELGIGNWGNLEDVPADLGEAYSLTLFPNPVSSERQLTVQVGGEFAEGNLRIFDATGRLVYFQKLGSGERTLQVKTSNWKSGIYLVQTLLDGKILTAKLIVE